MKTVSELLFYQVAHTSLKSSMKLQFYWFTSVQLLVEILVATRTLQNYARSLP